MQLTTPHLHRTCRARRACTEAERQRRVEYRVVGVSHTNAGVYGKGSRGAVLTGTKAQARLVPSKAESHPASGNAGDLFVDASGRLWFCNQASTTAATWTQLA